ncbi:AGL143Cp [Eremothecium gossypii ATCC 10895]|uniref:AGL143Cp n=1 Tax=Eremothecium gossypii (strain ATCC 10895 / CBS 109.51 / FGSC 9923 / NRRL Y-1056) TaxID=284811 RepID=Q750T2_EREGS|nr:AGL143Cp [Eremothecium gossypii ATCC 10895]AAS54348.2 AGL143Cp [Eremothecium gossypii ATCC 10895]AEY98675.1 FAGL143Cp [Eremothecium gossypii FDAG1]
MILEANDSLFGPLFKRHSHSHSEEPEECPTENEYDGSDGIRILSVFIILLASAIGTFFPMLGSRFSRVRLPTWAFFFAKYFGSGVIVATGFIHLLLHGHESLSNPCLGGVLSEYPWAFAICMMSLFTLFFVEINSHHFVNKAARSTAVAVAGDEKSIKEDESTEDTPPKPNTAVSGANSAVVSQHFAHDECHQDLEQAKSLAADPNREQYLNQLISLFILEFGVVFHSVLIGLSLAVTAEDHFTTLFVVLIFHQMFEGMGLGARIAETEWGVHRKWTPWLLGLGYCLSTPIAIAIGLGVRHSFAPESRPSLIVNGVFDSLSAGILLYTGLIELMAHEFLFSNSFKGEGGFNKMMQGFVYMCLGAGLMALLGKWA